MPELPSSPARALEESEEGSPLDPAVDAITQDVLAVESGPEGRSAKKRLGLGAWLAIAWLVLIGGAAATAPYLPIEDPDSSTKAMLVAEGRTAPSVDAWLGVDSSGRDLVSRVIWGARSTLLIGVGSIAVGVFVGGFFGLCAGFYRGRIAIVIASGLDILLAIPPIVLALFIVTIFENKTVPILIVALGIVSIPILARITRASTISWSSRDFVTAGRALGAADARLMVREVLPNVLPAMFSIALLGVAVVIVAEGGLSILGISVTEVTWGNMIAAARTDLTTNPTSVFIPSAAIFLTVLSLNYLGDVVRTRFDVREAVL